MILFTDLQEMLQLPVLQESNEDKMAFPGDKKASSEEDQGAGPKSRRAPWYRLVQVWRRPITG